MFSNTTARPVCRMRPGLAADGFSTAPFGARLPRTIARPPCSTSGRDSSRITSSLKHSASATLSASVASDTDGASPCSRPASSSRFITTGRPPA